MTTKPLLGCAVYAPALEQDAAYRELIARLFDVVTPENVMKFALLRPNRDTYDFVRADRLMAFAEDNGLRVRGHTLVWHNQLPDWVADAEPGERKAILAEHIQGVLSRYRGRIWQWDVVNEPLDDDGVPRQSPWFEAMGIDYIAEAFHLAHEADPAARLFLNDYNVEDLGTKSDAYFELMGRLLAEGVPIHGFGIQGHRIVGDPPTSMRENLRRFAGLGLEVAVTEVDVRIPMAATAKSLEMQAADYRRQWDDVQEIPECSAFVLWGVSDRYSWIPKAFPGFGAAHVLDENLHPKPAFESIFGQSHSE